MTHHRWVSVAEAARHLGVSVSTVRRMVEDGKLVGEREPMGGNRDRFRVRLDAPEMHQDASPSESPVPQDAPEDASATHQDVSAIVMAATAPLETVIAHQRVKIETQGERIAELERENGRLEAERDALSYAEQARRERPWWRWWR